MAEQVHLEREVRGIPLWLLHQYLLDIGGEPVTDHEVQGPGWQVFLTQLEDFRLGSLAVGQVRIEVNATEEAMSAFLPGLEKKLLRAGG